ncbi:hypothetical protein EV386_1116 [Xylanimonas ulmi]|uniref:Uncharacterized protein n=1 Tax=Xylanimonas ulmi TaxID=228973 RepID=A0A4Q7LZI7_9MICO|nr:hypothetical protein EV386_1116 [Xylanibacterium ulmi]
MIRSTATDRGGALTCACPGLGAQRRFDLHRTDLIDHSCGTLHV